MKSGNVRLLVMLGSSPSIGERKPDWVAAAVAFRERLKAIKASIPNRWFEWYPYDTLTNVGHLDKLLSGKGYDLDGLLAEGPVLDVGCADGDLAFFLESLGACVTAIDHPRGNHNGMAGVRALRQALGSSVDVREMDLDAEFQLAAGDHYGLAVMLGVLYHLKNPFYVLETLARHSRYCLLSTRITHFVPAVDTAVNRVPLAYLVDADELNADNSNFWIFTEAGLERLLKRTHWNVLLRMKMGAVGASYPHTVEHDERIFCLLRSQFGETNLDMVAGWHAPEDSGWRWTAREFKARLRVRQPGNYSLEVELYVPEALVQRYGGVTLTGAVNGESLAPHRYETPGLYTYCRRVAVQQEEALLEFSLDHALPPDAADSRERGVIVADVRLR